MPPSPVRGSLNSRATSSSAQPPRADQLERLSADLDLLIRDERLGNPTPRTIEDNQAEGLRIALALTQLYVGKAKAERLVNPPIKITADGLWF